MHFSQILAEFMDAPNEKLVIQTNSPAMFAVFLPCLQVCLFFPQTKKQQLARYPPGERSHIFCQGYVWVDDCPYQGGIFDRSLEGKIIVNVIKRPVGSEFYVIKAGSATVSVSQDWWLVKVPTVKKNARVWLLANLYKSHILHVCPCMVHVCMHRYIGRLVKWCKEYTYA